MKKVVRTHRFLLVGALAAFAAFAPARAAHQVENLGRGIVAMRTGTSSVYVGWRLLGLDPANIAFNVYRSANGGTPVLLNSSPITTSTNYVDNTANFSQSNAYTVRPVIGGSEQPASAPYTLPANAPTQQYIRVPLNRPPGGTTPSGENYTYSPGDASVGDLDGDGEYELVLKWDPSNQKDSSQDGYTGNVYLDAYEFNGTRLWRIDLGRNIRAGAHYTQFQVFDYDGDGRAEVAVKTADATISGTGQVIGNGSANHRNSLGHILTGPEFFTVFNGQTGAILVNTAFVVDRDPVSSWGDSEGNRSERYLSITAYLDGSRPSIIMCRGYYERSSLTAWDWRNGTLTQRWVFDSNVVGGSYWGRGAHFVSVADVDGNSTHEIIYGAMTVNANGTGRYTTSFYGHGDTLHVSDFLPSRAGQEIWMVHEAAGVPAATLRDANTGATIFSKSHSSDEGPGRGTAGDIYAGSAGGEFWGSGPGLGNLYSTTGANIGRNPSSSNFVVWWDGDFTRELLDGNHVDKYGTSSDTRLLTATGASSINGSKSTPNLSADLFGDWREEIIFTEGTSALRIYTTTTVANNRVHTLMHDPQYRCQVAGQNSAYNQPPHPSFYLGGGAPAQPKPNIVYVGGPPVDTNLYQAENATPGGGAFVETTNSGYNGGGYINFPANGGTLTFSNVDGEGGGSKAITFRYANGSAGSRTGSLTVNGSTSNITFPTTSSWTTWATLSVTVTLNNSSSNTIVLQSTGQDLANIDELFVPEGSTPTPDTYQAESATAAGGVTIDSNNGGFNGTGFANFPANGGTLTFNNVDGNGGGAKSLAIRYALGAAGSRTGSITVNGTTSNITFNSTGSWSTWATLNVNITLNNNSTNTIRFASTGQDLANLDEITVP